MLESFLDSVKDIVFIKDSDGVYLGCNPAFTDYVGLPREHIVGKTDYDLFDRQTADHFRLYDQRMLERRHPCQNEEWVTYPNGGRRLLDTVKTPFWAPDGSLVGVLGISRDMTERHQTEEALRESEANFRAFFETIDDLILVATRAGKIVFCNTACERKLGYTRDELFSLHVLDLHHAACRDEAEVILQAMLCGERETCPLPLATKSGELLPVETRVWFGRWGGTDCIFGVSKDLSAEQEAKQRFERLFRSNPYPMVLATFPGNRMLDVNDAIVQATGYGRDELIGRTAIEVGFYVRPEERLKATERLIVEGRVKDIQLDFRHKDGRVMTTLFSGEVFENQGEKFLMLVFMDITARKQAEDSLRIERGRLDGILRGTNAGTWEWNVQTGETLFNERWADIVGYTLEELQPISIRTWERLTHPEDLAASAEALHRHFRKEAEFYELEARMRHKSGEWVWVLDRGRVMSWTPEGLPLWMLGTHQDITPRKRAEEDLQRLSRIQGELMHLSTGFVNLPVSRHDEAIDQSLAIMGRLIQADRAYLFLYDFETDVMANTHEWCNKGITPELANLQQIPNSLFPEWVAAHRNGRLVHIPSVSQLSPDDNLRRVLEPQGIQSLITLPLMQGSTCLGYVGFDAVREARVWKADEVALLRVLAELFANFQARRAAELENRELQRSLTEARDVAQEAVIAKTLFLANMSHEIRTPLNAILGYAQMMARDCCECHKAQHLPALKKSAEHLLELLNDLLDLARTDGKQLIVVQEDVDLRQTLEDVRMMFAQRLEAQALSLHVWCAPDLPAWIRGDQRKIRQILINLVGNAVTFTAKGGIRIRATHSAEDAQDAALITVDVEDTGCGIPARDLERIFELFAQTENGQKLGRGTGLGLPLSRRYARAMGGDITASSTPGTGSRFRFTFRACHGTKDDLSDNQEHGRGLPLDAPSTASDDALAAMACVPVAQRLLLDQAIRRGDIRLLRSTVEEIAHEHAALADRLRAYAAAYDYDGIRRLVMFAQGEPT